MNDPGNGKQPHPPATDDDAELGARLDALGQKLAARRGDSVKSTPRMSMRGDGQAYSLGLRITTDLVAGALVGGLIGWVVDAAIGTTPWGLIVMLLFGVAAGILLALRTAGLVQERSWRIGRGDSEEDG